MTNRWKAGLVGLTTLVLSCCPTQKTLESSESFIPGKYFPTIVKYSDRANSKITYLYDNITRKDDGVEFALCLEGEATKDTLYVNDVRMPLMFSADRENVVWEKSSCDIPNYVGYLHSHPVVKGFNNCFLSMRDWKTFLVDAPANTYISGLACEDSIHSFFMPSPADQSRILDKIKESAGKEYDQQN